MKIHAYKVVTDNNEKLDNIFTYMKSKNPTTRIKNTATSRMRFEAGAKSKQNVWTLDFTKFRNAGPGRAPESSANVDFDLADDEFFGEETAGLYYPQNDVLILQYNHNGPRSASIENYINIMASAAKAAGRTLITDVSLTPIARSDAAQRLQKAKIVKTLEFSLFIPGVCSAPPKARVSLSSFLDNAVVGSAKNISVKISAGRTGSLNVPEVKEIVAGMLGLQEDVSQLRVKASESEQDPSSTIDMLEARLEAERTLVPSSKKRHDRNQRWAAIGSAYDEWSSKNLL